jgi:hypothetical protein
MTPANTAGATFGLGALSSAISGFGKIEQGQQEKKAYDYNADITLQNTQNEVVANQQKFSERIGQQASTYAASGVDIQSGSPLLIMAATAARGGQQGEQIEEAGTEEAALQRYYGKIAAFGGTMSGIGAFLNGLSSDASAYNKATAPTPQPTGP